VDPLLGVKVKTSCYPAARWGAGRRRILGAQLYASNTYHVMSRTCGGVVFFDGTKKGNRYLAGSKAELGLCGWLSASTHC
jgi:hypothetical protein